MSSAAGSASQDGRLNGRTIQLLAPFIMLVCLAAASRYSFLLYHTLIEFFTVLTAYSTAIIAWQTHRLTRNYFVAFLGLGYFFVATFDIAHVLSFPGLVSDDPSMVTFTSQYWLLARLLQSTVLILAPWFLDRRFHGGWVIAGWCVYSVLGLAAVNSGYFPVTFDSEHGLTTFKIVSEAVCMALLIVAWAILYARRELAHPKIVRPILASIALTIVAEFFFTQYVTGVDADATVGHVFRFASYWLIFTVFNNIVITEPILVLARGSYTFDVFPEPVLLTDVNGFIRQTNVACRPSGHSPAAIIGANVHDEMHPSTVKRGDCPVCSRLQDIDRTTVVLLEESEEITYEVTLSPIKLGPSTYGIVHVVRDVSERRRIQRERERVFAAGEQARRELESANRLKDEFLATISHELRNPLAVIKGGLHILKQQESCDAATRRVIDKIDRNSRLLAHIVNDLLDVSRMLQGKLALDLRPLAADHTVKGVLADVEELAAAKQITVTDAIDSSLVIKGDDARLRQVIWNLLSNAIKFTPEGGRVSVAATRVGHAVEVRVRDDGIGIEPSFLPHVFERFRQQDNSITRSFGGLGLGLAIVRAFTNAMNGDVRVESSGLGQGATFTLRFPAHDQD